MLQASCVHLSLRYRQHIFLCLRWWPSFTPFCYLRRHEGSEEVDTSTRLDTLMALTLSYNLRQTAALRRLRVWCKLTTWLRKRYQSNFHQFNLIRLALHHFVTLVRTISLKNNCSLHPRPHQPSMPPTVHPTSVRTSAWSLYNPLHLVSRTVSSLTGCPF